jgi:hypothetical protein
MHYAAESGCRPLLAQYCQKVIPGIVAVLAGAAMDQDWEPYGCGKLQLLPEDLLLNVTGRVVVMVVEANLANGDDLGVLCEPLHVREVRGGEQACFMGMDPKGCVDPGVLFGDGDGAGDVVWTFSVANGEEGADTDLVSALNGSFAIRGELGSVEMSV